MKKILLSVAFLGATFIGAEAQETISFEASEGFTSGNINGQNSWITTPITDNNGNIVGNIEDQNVTSENASKGTQSLKMDKVADFGPQSSLNMGAFYELPNPYQETAEYVVGFDFYGNEQTDQTSDFLISGYSDSPNSAGFTVSFYLRLRFNGTIYVADEGQNQQNQTTLVVTNTNATWGIQTWNSVKIVISQSQANVKYYLNDVLIHTSTGMALNNNPLAEIDISHDNYGGYMYFDNIYIGDEAGFSTEDFQTTSFSIYPNPATDVINISNSLDVIENVKITDLNGRVVKEIASDIEKVQINISDLAQGVYILNATSNGRTITEKIVKK